MAEYRAWRAAPAAEARLEEPMSGSDLDRVVEQYHRALDAFVRGDPELQKKLFSRREDVSLANPLGPPARGWSAVEQTMERAVSQLREGEPINFERISGCVGTELAYTVEIERARAKVGGSDEVSPISLRVTTIFRLEDGQWKVLHRHADPITSPWPIESIVQV
jgi:ketosteroid isomerase-like protein